MSLFGSRLVGVTGFIGSGKSTVARLLQEQGYTEYALATPLKKIGEAFLFEPHQLYGTQTEKMEVHSDWEVSGRYFLQRFGTDLCRCHLAEALPALRLDGWTPWVRILEIYVKRHPEQIVVVPDLRFLDEERMIRLLGGKILRIERSATDPSDLSNLHASEREIPLITPDVTIVNNGTLAELEEKINELFH